MFVKVTLDGGVSLVDVDNFSRFSVVALQGVDTDTALRRSAAGYLPDPDSDARISVDWIRAKGEEMSLPMSWNDSLEGMLEYARSKNWFNEDGTITAHVELNA
jgi:hypothetical protein